jgi:hypothetical protein
VPFGFQAHAHYAVEGQGQEADERMGADAVRQAMVNRGDLDVGFEDSKSSLDIGEPLVARDGRSGTDVRGVGDQRERAVEELRGGEGFGFHSRIPSGVGDVGGMPKAGDRVDHCAAVADRRAKGLCLGQGLTTG